MVWTWRYWMKDVEYRVNRGRKRGRPRRRFMDVVKEEMQRVRVTEEQCLPLTSQMR